MRQFCSIVHENKAVRSLPNNRVILEELIIDQLLKSLPGFVISESLLPVHNIPPLDPFFRYVNPVHVLTSHFSKSYLILYIHLHPVPPSFLFH